jgi:integrase
VILHNYSINYRPDATGIEAVVPGLLDSSAQVVMPLLRYQVHLYMKSASQSHLQNVREAVRLFAEYSAANMPSPEFGSGQTGHVQVVRHHDHFRNFRFAIVMGTFGPNGVDPSGLNWVARGAQKANRVVQILTEFFVWLDELDGGNRASRFNPLVTPTNYEVLCAASAYEYRRNEALLGHTWAHAGEAANVSRAVAGSERGAAAKDVKRIEDREFERLLQHGFDASTEVGLRDALLTMLMNKTGVRVSEALGAWVIDVMDDPAYPGSAHIKLRHPSRAKVKLSHKGITYTRRVDYLKGACGLPDRIRLPKNDPQHLGWKGRFDVLELYWAEPWWGRVFWRLYCIYVRMTAAKRTNHPYLFVDSESGQPLTYDAFAKSYKRAVYRAGLVPEGCLSLKDTGLTPHGNRHGYGNRLKLVYGCSEKVVQNALHHTSPESQIVYTVPSGRQTREEIEQGMQKMRIRQRELDDMKKALKEVKSEIENKSAKAGGWQSIEALPESLKTLIEKGSFA